MTSKDLQKGFTLIELLIVIAIIAIIAAVTFVALNPLQRFQDARDSSRWSDVSALLTAIKVDQIDNGGSYVSAITSITNTIPYLITGAASSVNPTTLTCDTAFTSSTALVNLSGLVTEGYLGEVPVSPNGSGSWSSTSVGYALTKNSNGSITISACESENTTEITLTR